MSAGAWYQPLPHWARVVCVLFGFANIGGAIAAASEMTFPGIVVGGVWALFGWKGLPLIASVPPHTPPDDVAAGLMTLRRRRLVAFVVPFAWLLLSAILLPRVPMRFLSTVFFLSAIPLFVLVFRCFFSACPRCRQHFFISSNLFHGSLTQCIHCGLPLRDPEDATSNNRWRGP
jgi:hypothetical protein